MWKLPVFFLIFFCFCVDFNNLLEALNTDDEGVCVVKISVRKTRQKAVPINKWCGKKKCVIKKIEHYTVPEDRLVCCKGYEYHVHTDYCLPICSTGCSGGRCTAPETCTCEPSAHLDLESHVCTPVDHVEVKQEANDTEDKQDEGYTKLDENKERLRPNDRLLDYNNPTIRTKTKLEGHTDNKTEQNDRLSKDSGHNNDDLNKNVNIDKECKCINNECINGSCICYTGYKNFNETLCVPECENRCVNSECINKTCVCKEGFQKLNDSLCVKCDDGYTLKDGNCMPQCKEDCVNSVCVKPDECKCLEGFNIKGKYSCEPLCENTCINSKCEEPNKCKCLEGFKPFNDNVCIPKCDCEVCVGPNICGCPQGFDSDNGTCKPVCKDCGNGYCKSPDVCSCNDGFVKNEANSSFSCVRRCDLPVTEDAKHQSQEVYDLSYINSGRKCEWTGY